MDKKEAIVIMCPTVNRVTEEWMQFCSKHQSLIKDAKRNPLSVKLINGDIWYFRGETEGARAYRGYHAEMVCIDEFPLDDLLGETFCKGELLDGTTDNI